MVRMQVLVNVWRHEAFCVRLCVSNGIGAQHLIEGLLADDALRRVCLQQVDQSSANLGRLKRPRASIPITLGRVREVIALVSPLRRARAPSRTEAARRIQ